MRDGLAEGILQFFLRQAVIAFQILHHQVVIRFGNQIAQVVARILGTRHILFGNLLNTLRAVFEVARLHAQHIDDALEIRTDADGDGYGAQARSVAGMQDSHGRVEVRTLTIDVVDEHAAAQAHLLRFAPQPIGHGGRPFHGIDDEHGHLNRLHGRQRVAHEIRLPRRVQQVDLEIFVQDGSNGGAQRELAANFFLVVVEVRFAVVRRSHAWRSSGNMQHRLGKRSLARTVLAD